MYPPRCALYSCHANITLIRLSMNVGHNEAIAHAAVWALVSTLNPLILSPSLENSQIFFLQAFGPNAQVSLQTQGEEYLSYG